MSAAGFPKAGFTLAVRRCSVWRRSLLRMTLSFPLASNLRLHRAASLGSITSHHSLLSLTGIPATAQYWQTPFQQTENACTARKWYLKLTTTLPSVKRATEPPQCCPRRGLPRHSSSGVDQNVVTPLPSTICALSWPRHRIACARQRSLLRLLTLAIGLSCTRPAGLTAFAVRTGWGRP